MLILENTVPTLPREGIFVLVGIGALLVLYVILRTVKSKKKPEPTVEIQHEDDDGETVAAITAAVAIMLEEEAEREERKPSSFRVVSFKRTNNRRIGE